ncbi:MAG: Mur ligase domain-containing protein, partial [Candidatus Aquilonibacter sp.]
MKLTFDEAVKATQAQVLDIEAAPAHVDVVTDTRTLQPGQTFLALRGERYDGHTYTAEAVERGAKALIVEDPDAAVAGTTTLVVEETLQAYLDLGGAARAHFRGRVLAITGSAGKTTTKAFAAQLLAVRYGDRILASRANENNEIGVS